jgi:hypothetical protein
MVDGSKKYSRQVWNESGYILYYPNLSTEEGYEGVLQDVPPNPYAQSATQLFPAGTVLQRGMEKWWYCKAGEALATLGTPIQSPAAVHAEQDDDITVGAAAAIGAYEVHLTSTNNLDTGALASKDGLKDGFLIVNDEAGEGQMYKIKTHNAFVTTGDVEIQLYDPLTVALTTSSQVGVIQNPCMDVIATKAVVTGMFVGVNQLAITDDYWFWAKMGGPAPGNMHTACAKGTYVVVGTTAAKFDPASAVTTELIVGEMLTPGVADTEKAIIYIYPRA